MAISTVPKVVAWVTPGKNTNTAVIMNDIFNNSNFMILLPQNIQQHPIHFNMTAARPGLVYLLYDYDELPAQSNISVNLKSKQLALLGYSKEKS